jgi:hypothetical protein
MNTSDHEKAADQCVLSELYYDCLDDRIAIGNIRLDFDLLSIRGLHPQTLVMVTRSEALRAIQGRLFGEQNFMDYAKDQVLRRGGS